MAQQGGSSGGDHDPAQVRPSFGRWLDDGVARGETAIAAVVLVAMVLVAAAQAILRNLSLHLGWARAALEQIGWTDAFLQTGTLVVAFLGASLATHSDKHLGIDVLQRIAPGRVQYAMRAVVGLGAATIAFMLARAFGDALLAKGLERPPAYDFLDVTGAMHVCDAPARAVAAAGLSRPGAFCAARWALARVGAPVETPRVMFQLVVPVMFLFISVRMGFKGATAAFALARGAGSGQTASGPRPHGR